MEKGRFNWNTQPPEHMYVVNKEDHTNFLNDSQHNLDIHWNTILVLLVRHFHTHWKSHTIHTRLQIATRRDIEFHTRFLLFLTRKNIGYVFSQRYTLTDYAFLVNNSVLKSIIYAHIQSVNNRRRSLAARCGRIHSKRKYGDDRESKRCAGVVRLAVFLHIFLTFIKTEKILSAGNFTRQCVMIDYC